MFSQVQRAGIVLSQHLLVILTHAKKNSRSHALYSLSISALKKKRQVKTMTGYSDLIFTFKLISALGGRREKKDWKITWKITGK